MIKIIVKYIDFHMDNHQGGSGKTVNGTMFLEIPDAVKCGDLREFIQDQLAQHLKARRPFGETEHGYQPTIVSVEMI